MSTEPRFDGLDRMSLDRLEDMVPAAVSRLPRTQHALMSGWGGPPQVRSCYFLVTDDQSFTISYRVPPGVTDVDVGFLVAVDGGHVNAVQLTSSVDSVGTELYFVGPGGPYFDELENAKWKRTNGTLDSAVGEHTGRALTVRSAVAWEWTDVDLTLELSTATGLVVYGLAFWPIHYAR